MRAVNLFSIAVDDESDVFSVSLFGFVTEVESRSLLDITWDEGDLYVDLFWMHIIRPEEE